MSCHTSRQGTGGRVERASQMLAICLDAKFKTMEILLRKKYSCLAKEILFCFVYLVSIHNSKGTHYVPCPKAEGEPSSHTPWSAEYMFVCLVLFCCFFTKSQAWHLRVSAFASTMSASKRKGYESNAQRFEPIKSSREAGRVSQSFIREPFQTLCSRPGQLTESPKTDSPH